MEGTGVSSSDKAIKKPKKIKPDGADGHRGRMFDKFLAAGDNDVLPRDIIEMLLYYPIKIRDTRDAAVYLMEKYGSADKLLSAPQDDLASTDGVGAGSAMFLRIVGSAVKRLADEPVDDRKIYSDTSETRELFYPFKEELKGEITCIACFDNAMRPIRVAKIKDGVWGENKDDAHTLVSFVTEHHGCSVALARVSSCRTDFPTATDFKAASYAASLLNKIDVRMLEYFVISRDEVMQAKQFHV